MNCANIRDCGETTELLPYAAPQVENPERALISTYSDARKRDKGEQRRRERLSNTDDGWKSPRYRNYPVIKYRCRGGGQWSGRTGIKKMQNGFPPAEVESARAFLFASSRNSIRGQTRQRGKRGRDQAKPDWRRVGHCVPPNAPTIVDTLLRDKRNARLPTPVLPCDANYGKWKRNEKSETQKAQHADRGIN